MYGELCDKDRLKNFVESFPEHPVVVFVEREWQNELRDVIYLIPHLEHNSSVKVLSKVSPKKLLTRAPMERKKRNYFSIYVLLGIILGSLFLLPTSFEYRSSVLTKVQSEKELSSQMIDSQPDPASVQQLYSNLANLYTLVRVEAITYSQGKYKVVFSSAEGNLTNTDLPGFESTTLTKVSSLKSKKETNVHIYEMEGGL